MTLETMLTRAGLSTYDRWTWFRDVALQGHTLLVPDRALAASIERCWLPQLREVMTDCCVRVEAPAVKPPQPKSPFKAAYRGYEPKGTQGDML